jgi:hypothetical protein
MFTVLLLALSALVGQGSAQGRADDLAGLRKTLPPEPRDVYPTNPAGSLEEFDKFCWETFLALNAAASTTSRGVARDGNPANPGADARTAWMTWRSIDDVFPADRSVPPAWDGDGQFAPRGQFRPHLLTSLAKTPLGDVNLAGAAVNSFIGPVIAQNRTFARFEIRFNQVAYEHILKYKLHDYHYLPGRGEIPDDFPAGSVVVKASWRLIEPSESAFKARCFWSSALIRDPFQPAEPARTQDAALVGLHVIVRTAKRRQWIWSSFEHVDNVPGPAGPVASKDYSFNYGVAYTGAPPANLDANAPAGSRPGIPAVLTALGPEGSGGPRPTQVERLQQVHPKTEATNALYQAALAGSAWQYYKLVVTQFPSQPDKNNAPLDGVPFPGAGGAVDGGLAVSVANTTMETYFQKTSCMECHQNAKNYGVSFVFSLGRALDRQPPPQRIAVARGILNRGLSPPSPLAGETGAIRHRVRIGEIDRDVLGPILRRMTPPARPARTLAPGAPAPPTVPAVSFDEVRNIFSDAIGRWKLQNLNCPPDMITKHGKSFGWVDNNPWATWDALLVARFSPSGAAGPGDLLVDPAAPTVREMLLIRVLRGPGVAQARGQRMPLNGPYLSESEIETVERFLSQQFNNKPIQ